MPESWTSNHDDKLKHSPNITNHILCFFPIPVLKLHVQPKRLNAYQEQTSLKVTTLLRLFGTSLARLPFVPRHGPVHGRGASTCDVTIQRRRDGANARRDCAAFSGLLLPEAFRFWPPHNGTNCRLPDVCQVVSSTLPLHVQPLLSG